MFLLGRTETIHPVSEHSVAWVKAMDDPNSTAAQCQQLLRLAVKKQSLSRLEATIGMGCDRHLLALYCSSRELGMAVPKLFMDKVGWLLLSQYMSTMGDLIKHRYRDYKKKQIAMM